MLSQRPDSPRLIIENFLQELAQHKWKGRFYHIQNKFDSIVFHILKELPPSDEAEVIKKIEPYAEKFYNTYKNASVRTYSIYAWLLEKKLNYCHTEEHRLSLEKIECIYQEFSKKHPYDGWWFIRINYLCFSSKYLSSDETIDLAFKFLDLKIYKIKHKPSNKQLSQIMSVLSIEYEKKGLSSQYRDYALKAIHYDPHYPVPYSMLGKYYNEEANIFLSLKKIEKAKSAMKLSEEYFEKARALDPMRFKKNHGTDSSSSTKIIYTDLIERENASNSSSCSNGNLNNTYWPPLISNVQEKIRREKIKKEFEERFPMPKTCLNYEIWAKENAEALAREEIIKYIIVDSHKKNLPPQTDKQETRETLNRPSIFLSSTKLKAGAAEFVPGQLKKS